MDHVEPITCSVCGRKFPPKFTACIYCKAPSPGVGTAEGEDSAAKLARASVRPVPAARIASSWAPPASASAAVAGEGAAPNPAPSPPRVVVPITPIDDAPGPSMSTWVVSAFALVAAAGAIYAFATMYARYKADRIDLYVVNTTGTSGMSLVVDEKVVAENIPSTPVESPTSARSIVIAPGAHTLEAREATGVLVATAAIDVTEGSHGFLFVPKRPAETCFAVERTEYGAGSDERIVPLDAKREVWEMTSAIDGWFVPNPTALSVSGGAGTVVRRAARMMPCAAFENGMIRRGSAAGTTAPGASGPSDAGADAP